MLRHIKPGMLVFSVLYILLGLLLLLAPQTVADVFCIALGLLVVLCGLQSLYGYFKKDNGSIRAAVSLLLSLPTIALGMWALLCTVQSAMTFEWLLPLLFGLMLLVDGVVRAQSSFALAKRKGQKWWVVLLLSIVSLLCGALLACSQLLNNRNVDLLLLSGIFSQMYASWIVIGSRTGEMESIVSQREINTDTASYLTALRAALRQINGIIYTSAAENMIAMDSSILQLYKDGRIDKHTAISEAVNPEIMSKRLNLL